MTFQPVIPFGGFAGWTFLNRTLETQQQSFNQSPLLQRNVEYFKETIGSINSAEQLVNDRQLLEVANRRVDDARPRWIRDRHTEPLQLR